MTKLSGRAIYEFGDILKYGPLEDPNDHYKWRFMHLLTEAGCNRVLVLAIEPDDDIWIAGETIVAAGINELVLAND